MHKKLLDYLQCISCGNNDLIIEERKTQEHHIMEGEIRCSKCNEKYPIKGGIPRFISSRFISKKDTNTGKAYNIFYKKADSGVLYGDGKLYCKTTEEEVIDFYHKTRLRKEYLSGKLLLDAGCGIGRLTDKLSNVCESVVGCDITPAVDRAFKITKDKNNVHIVQADLLNLPFKKKMFDIVWCDGVLPYVSDFKKGLLSLIYQRKDDGFLYTWCYKNRFKKLSFLSLERIGQKAHSIPIPIRFKSLVAIVFFLRLLQSMKQKRNLLHRIYTAAATAFDYSLAAGINHVSLHEIEKMLDESSVKEFNIFEAQDVVNMVIS